MRTYFYISLIVFISFNLKSFGQDNIVSGMPQENIFLHFNSTLLFSGENLYYKVYCLNNDTKVLSNLSKIAYVEVIGSDNSIIFKQKIRLENGVGQGDYFVSANIPSGNYKLVAYTQWMRNGSRNNFFQNDLTIINPFQSNQSSLLGKKDFMNVLAEKYDFEKEIVGTAHQLSDDGLKIFTNKKSYSKREQVKVEIKDLNSNSRKGNYSLSIKKMDTIAKSEMYNTLNYQRLFDGNSWSKDNRIAYLPELRGELLSGKVMKINDNTPAPNVNVSLSVPGKDFILKIATTNREGIFYINLEENYASKNGVFQVVNEERKDYKLQLLSTKPYSYMDLEFSDFCISPSMEKFILDRSVENQIANAYSNTKVDILDSIPSRTNFSTENAITFVLDDYNRFPSIKETIIEIIKPIYVRQRKGMVTIHIKLRDDIIDTGILPLVLLDGMLIQNHDELLAYSARNIKKIIITKNHIIYGTKKFNGIIEFESFEGDYSTIATGDFIKKVDLFNPLAGKIYFKEDYNNQSKSNRIPDYRNQLLWLPTMDLSSNKKEIIFYTSDISGYYQISLEGFSEDGKAVSKRTSFRVD